MRSSRPSLSRRKDDSLTPSWQRFRLHPLDWSALGLLLAGVECIAAGWLPTTEAVGTVKRVLPLLLFLATVIVLAELTALAEVFDIVATKLAIITRGSYLGLFVLLVLLTSLTTIGLNLDTTTVLLTPVLLALARTLAVPLCRSP